MRRHSLISDDHSTLRPTDTPSELTLPAPEPDAIADTAEPAPGPTPAQVDVGREHALAALFATSYTPLVRLATLLGADDPENVVAEAFYQLYRRWPRLNDAGMADSYVKSVVCNLTRMRIRHLQVVRRHVQTLQGQEPAAGEHAHSAEALALRHEDQIVLVQIVQQLPVRQREALVLRHWMDLPEREMAQIMGISAGSVKTHLRRGIAALTAAMEPRS